MLQDRDRQRREKEEHAQMLYMQKLTAETQRRQQAEGLMSQLEREEKELINRLRKTQHMQEKAYAELQKSLRA